MPRLAERKRLIRILAGTKAGGVRKGGVEGVAIERIVSRLSEVRNWWRMRLLAAEGPDGLLARVPDLDYPSTIERDWIATLQDAKKWGAIAGWFSGQRALHDRKLRFDNPPRDKPASTLEPPPNLPRTLTGLFGEGADPIISAIVKGQIDHDVPRPELEWFSTFDFDVNRKWPDGLRDKARDLLVAGEQEGKAVRTMIGELDSLLSDSNVPRMSVPAAGWLENVVRTNSASMASAGELLAYHDADEIVAYEIFAITDDRLCPECEPLDGMVFSKEDVEAGDGLLPPFHDMCRCSAAPVTSSDTDLLDKMSDLAGAQDAIRSHMESLEAEGDKAALGARDAQSRYAQYEKHLERGFGGGRITDGLRAAGLLN